MNKIRLKRDLVIPAGTVFENCDGEKIDYAHGNFRASIATSDDGVLDVYTHTDAIKDRPDLFGDKTDWEELKDGTPENPFLPEDYKANLKKYMANHVKPDPNHVKPGPNGVGI